MSTYLLIVTLVISLVAVAGMFYNFQNSDAIGFHTHPTHITKLPEPFDNAENLQALTNLEAKIDEQRLEYTREIVAVKLDLANAQIGTGDAQRDSLDEQTGSGTSPKLSIHLDSNEFIKGEIIWISGTADPLLPIQATITDPNGNKRYPNASVDKNGSYKLAYTTDFDSLLGQYKVFVKSQGESSQTLSFILK